MLTQKSSTRSLGVAAALGGMMLISTTMAMTAEAQSGRVKARTDRGVATAVSGPNGNRAARARGCTEVSCGSSAGVIGANGALAGRASASQFGEDGSFSRDAGAYARTQYGQGTRTLNTQLNPDGSGQRSINGYAQSGTGLAERNSLLTIDENGNASRSGVAYGSNNFGAFSSQGVGTYSYENGLDYARESHAAAAGEAGNFYADRASSYDQGTGFRLNNSTGWAVSGENGSAQSQTNSSYTRDGGYVLGRDTSGTNAAGGTWDANVYYDAQNGLERSIICTNPQGEVISCTN